MKPLVAAFLAAFLLFSPLCSTASNSFDKISQSVRRLTITVMNEELGPGKGYCTASSINSEKGYWLTAAHCAVGDLSIDGKDAVPKYIGLREDVAVLWVDDYKVKPLKFGEKEPRVGDELIIVGHPLGLENVVQFKGRLASKNLVDNKKDWFLFDMTACGGNSGSAVLNNKGEVVSMLQFGYGNGCSGLTGGATFLDLVKTVKSYFGR